ARNMMIGLYLLFAFSVFIVTRKYFGKTASLFALLLFILEPNMAAHGHLVNTDIPIAFFLFLTCVSWLEYLKSRRKFWLSITAFLFAFSQYAKFSAVALIPIMGGMALVYWFVIERISLKKLVLRLLSVILPGLFILAVTFAVIWIGYGMPFSVSHSVYDPANTDLPYWMNEGRFFQAFAVPAQFWKGYWLLTRDIFLKREAYLFGMFKKGGWWYYFPVAFLIKTPLPLIFTFLGGLAVSLARRRQVTPAMIAVLIPPLGFMAISMAGTMDIGLRHIFPVYPFVIIWAGYSAAFFLRFLRQQQRIAKTARQKSFVWFGALACAALMIWYLGGTISHYPRLLSYFNETVGTTNGWKALNDSNLDWGQNAGEFRDYLTAKGISQPNCTYFWSHEQLKYYGIRCNFINSYADFQSLREGSLYFIDAMDLKSPEWEWARTLPLVDRVGDTIFVFRKDS
ncbi:hypothetical protein AUK40_01800, partial [Candidatus Wirthbacteria bacterium CG2_30_54_11]